MVKLYSSHIITAEVEVIINPVTTRFSHVGDDARVLFSTAGEELVLEQKKIGFIPLGEFAVTGAGNLWAKKVFHISVFDHENNRPISYEEFEHTWRRVLVWCKSNAFKTVAAPLIGQGLEHWDLDRLKETMFSVSREFNGLHVFIFNGQIKQKKIDN